MYRAVLIALSLGVANANYAIEWKGTFATADNEYTWYADKTLKKANTWAYTDATMALAAIPGATLPACSGTCTGADWEAAAATHDAAGTTALQQTCESVQHGGTIVPNASKCFNLVFDNAVATSTYKVDTSSAAYVAFFAQHVPTEFEAVNHYLKDTKADPVDNEPLAQCEGATCTQKAPAPTPAGSSHAHGHGGGSSGWNDDFSGKCACQARAHNWAIDCTTAAGTAKVTTAVENLKDGTKIGVAAGACASINPPQACIDNFYVLQTHHDHCLTNVVPTAYEKDFHDFEAFYTSCFVKRQFNPSLSVCPSVPCSPQTEMRLAVQTLKTNNCNNVTKCAEKVCADAIKTVLMAHDICSQSQLPDDLEKELHNYEEACKAQLCNSAAAAFDLSAESCSASVASDGFALRASFLMTWALPLVMLLQ